MTGPRIGGTGTTSDSAGSQPADDGSAQPPNVDEILNHLEPLQRGGHHLIPMRVSESGKIPAVQWRRGGTDYVETQPSKAQVKRWAESLSADIWASLCGGPGNRLVLDIEAAGMANPVIAKAVGSLPDTCKRSTPHGMHCWLEDVEVPEGERTFASTKMAYSVPTEGKPILMAEIRGHGGYAVIVGPGRGAVAEPWEPYRIKRDELLAVINQIRSADERTEKVKQGSHPHAGRPVGDRGEWMPKDYSGAAAPTDTAEVLWRAVATGQLSITQLMDDGWTDLGHDVDGRKSLLRPDYGQASKAESSGNELYGSTIIWSMAVEWAEPEVSMTPAVVLARARFGGDHAKAMRAVERAAVSNPIPAPFTDWPAEVLADVRKARLGVNDHRPTVLVTTGPEFGDWLRANLGTGPTSEVFRGNAGRLAITAALGDPEYIPPPPAAEGVITSNGPATQHAIMTSPALGAVLASRIMTVRVTEKGLVRTDPPPSALNQAVAMPSLLTGTKDVLGFTHTPVLRADGSVLDQPGYDSATQLIYAPQDLGPITVAERKADAVAAGGLLMDLVKDFSFVTEHDRANYLALLLTPALMPMLADPAPLGGITASNLGSGKTLLCDVIGDLYGGAVVRPPLDSSEEEIAKVLGTIFLTTTSPVVTFDNCYGVIRSNKLAQLATSRRTYQRLLGSSLDIEMINTRLILINGNNLLIGGDLGRRFAYVRIDPGMPKAYEREADTFAIPALRAHILAHRGELLGAVLTIVRAWVVAGRPTKIKPRADTFASWLTLTAGALAFAGVSGSVLHPDTDIAPIGADDEDLVAFLGYAQQRFGTGTQWTVKDLVDTQWPGGSSMVNITDEQLIEVLPDSVIKGDHHTINRKSLGWWLKRQVGKWGGDLRLVRHEMGDGPRYSVTIRQ